MSWVTEIIYRLLNGAGKLTANLSPNAKRRVRMLLYVLTFLCGMFYASVPYSVHLLRKCIIGALLLGLLILFSIQGEIHRAAWNRKIAALWFLFGMTQLVGGLVVSLEYLPMAAILIVGFPLLYLVWNSRRDYQNLFLEVCKAGNICVVFMLATSILMVPASAGYSGITLNPNGLGQWMTFGFPMVLYCSHLKKGRRIWTAAYWAEIAAIYLMLVFARGRTALLAVGIETLVWLGLNLWNDREGISKVLTRMVCFLGCAAITVMCMWALNRNVAPVISDAVYTQIERWNDVGTLDEQSGKNQTELRNKRKQPLSAMQMLEGVVARVSGEDKESSKLDDYSSGRTVIWRATIESLNWLGHPSREHIITDRNGDVGNNTHNAALQCAYDNGILSGVVYILMVLLAGITMLKWAVLRGKNEVYLRFCVVVHAGYVMTAMLASINLPFIYLISFLYYLTYAVAFDGALTYEK